jgi:hypothetical protein
MLNPWKRVKALEADKARLAKRVKELEGADFRKQALEADKKRMKQEEETKRFEAKAGISKELIREMRAAFRSAIISIEDLAGRKPNQVTASHLQQLANEAQQLKRFTDL